MKTWLVAAIGLGSLVVLIAVSMLASSHKAEEIYAQLDALNGHHRRVEAIRTGRASASSSNAPMWLASRCDDETRTPNDRT